MSDFKRRAVLISFAVLVPVPILMRWADKPAALFFHAYRDTSWVHVFAIITNLANGWIWYSAAVLGVIVARRRHAGGPTARRETRAWAYMIVAMATSGIAENILKFAIGRERPRFLFEEGSAGFQPFHWAIANSSFPSGHSQSICAAMTALAFLFPPLRAAFFLVAVTVAASRIVIGAHFLSDVVAGAWLGTITAVCFRHAFERRGKSVTLWTSSDDRRSDPATSAPPPARPN